MLRRKIWAVTVLATLGATPLLAGSAIAQDRNDHAQRQEEQRMYDSAHKDYHNWNGDEDRRYREFTVERHRKYQDFSRLSKRRQNEYWQWRHEHDDHR
jgi:hypothetical protein